MTIKETLETKRKIVSYIDLLDLINKGDETSISLCKTMAFSNAKYILDNYDIKDALPLVPKEIKKDLEEEKGLSLLIKDEETDNSTSFLNWCLIYDYLSAKNMKEVTENFNEIKDSLYRLIVLNLEREIKNLDEKERENIVANVLPSHIIDWYTDKLSNRRK